MGSLKVLVDVRHVICHVKLPNIFYLSPGDT